MRPVGNGNPQREGKMNEGSGIDVKKNFEMNEKRKKAQKRK